MMIHCNNCKKKFYLINENSELEGKIVQCKYCNEKWLYESKTKYLENRLAELNTDLELTVNSIDTHDISVNEEELRQDASFLEDFLDGT